MRDRVTSLVGSPPFRINTSYGAALPVEEHVFAFADSAIDSSLVGGIDGEYDLIDRIGAIHFGFIPPLIGAGGSENGVVEVIRRALTDSSYPFVVRIGGVDCQVEPNHRVATQLGLQTVEIDAGHPACPLRIFAKQIGRLLVGNGDKRILEIGR